MKTDCIEELIQERQKLDQMIEDALNRGVAIADDEEIQKQSRLVERLMDKAEQARMRCDSYENGRGYLYLNPYDSCTHS